MNPLFRPEPPPVCKVKPCEQDFCPLTGKECHRKYPWRKTALGLFALTEPKPDNRRR